jgi:hypothetical protein
MKAQFKIDDPFTSVQRDDVWSATHCEESHNVASEILEDTDLELEVTE